MEVRATNNEVIVGHWRCRFVPAPSAGHNATIHTLMLSIGHFCVYCESFSPFCEIAIRKNGCNFAK